MTIHQPQYIPWLPYFLKIEAADTFIVLDSVDFQKNGLQNRNQIKTAQGAHWLTVPVRQRLGQAIVDVQIDDTSQWHKKHWATLLQNYRKAPAFELYAGDLERLFEQSWPRLVDLNIEMIRLMLRWLGIDRPMVRSSEMSSAGRASELVLNLCREAGATHYVSGTGGHAYLDEAAFAAAGIALTYLPPELPREYPQQHPRAGFLNDLSALDVLLNCGAEWRQFLPAAA